jgi:RNA-splicing ligase RtcB
MRPEKRNQKFKKWESEPQYRVGITDMVDRKYLQKPIVKSHIKYLETMAKLWPINVKRREANDRFDHEAIAKLDKEQNEVIKHGLMIHVYQLMRHSP